MELLDKKKYISKHLSEADEQVVNELYELLHTRLELKEEYLRRAESAEQDIKEGRTFAREQIEELISVKDR